MSPELLEILSRNVHFGCLTVCKKVHLSSSLTDRYLDDMKQTVWVEVIKALQRNYNGSVKETSFLKVVIPRAALQFLWKEKLVAHPQHKVKCVPKFIQMNYRDYIWRKNERVRPAYQDA